MEYLTMRARLCFLLVLAITTLSACSVTNTAEDPPSDAFQDSLPIPDTATSLTAQQCVDQGGEIIGDIGDGRIHRPDYRCPGGQVPLGKITPDGDEPIASEGSVCCH